MIQKSLLAGLILFLGLSNFSVAQKDFDNYKTMLSSGKMPKDFLERTSDKIENDKDQSDRDLKRQEEKIFLNRIYYGVDELLQSGLVTYGDEISLYVKSVADKLLAKEGKLKDNLRFYTIKSNVANAFSTDQGIVFVTTGLISQLVNEAQLAYILAHEITHYTEKHLVTSFKYESANKGFSNQIVQLSTYSKEKEFDADKKGIAFYNAAGYAKSEITTTFDVLMYSYLPIDEIPFTVDYFSKGLNYLPKDVFTLKSFDITAEEDFDDSKSTHPNIKKRKEKALNEADGFSKWGDATELLGKDQFKYIRNICRFERVRSAIINADFDDALYTIYILEREFPTSVYLTRMKAHCWFGMVAHMNSKHDKALKKKTKEGSGATMYQFLVDLKPKEMATLAMRQIEDARIAYPDDIEISVLRDRMAEQFYETEGIEFKNFHDLTYNEAIKQFKAESKDGDTSTETEKLSKYDRISKGKNNTLSGTFDSTLYYLYSLSDLAKNDEFRSTLKKLQDEEDAEAKKLKDYEKLSARDKKKFDKKEDFESNRTNLSSFILFEPAATSYKRGKVHFAKSEALAERYTRAFGKAADDMNLKVATVGKTEYENSGTEGFNQKALFTSLLVQIAQNESIGVFPVDYSMLNEVNAKYKTNKLVFTLLEHSYSANFGYVIYAFIAPPILPAAIINPILKGNSTTIQLFVLDSKTGKVDTYREFYFSEPTYELFLQTRVYDILNDTHLPK